MLMTQVVGYFMIIGPIALLLYMFIKSEMDQALIMDGNGNLLVQ